MNYKKMREYTHEEFVNLVMSLNEKELLDLSSNYGGYPVLFRMSLDERISHIPFIQTGLQLLLEIKMAKYYYRRELTEISGDYLEVVKI